MRWTGMLERLVGHGVGACGRPRRSERKKNLPKEDHPKKCQSTELLKWHRYKGAWEKISLGEAERESMQCSSTMVVGQVRRTALILLFDAWDSRAEIMSELRRDSPFIRCGRCASRASAWGVVLQASGSLNRNDLARLEALVLGARCTFSP